MYKSKLQGFCHKQKWSLPIYTCLRGGQDHCPMFKASVLVKGSTFDTPTICKSPKQAFNQAAKVAFLHFTSDPSNQSSENVEKENGEKEIQSAKVEVDDVAVKQEESEKDAAAIDALYSLPANVYDENDPCFYKDLLRNLTRSEGYFLPKYTTTESDDSPCRTFSCSVEVEGSVFQGAASKSKKLAELKMLPRLHIPSLWSASYLNLATFHLSVMTYSHLLLARAQSPIPTKKEIPKLMEDRTSPSPILRSPLGSESYQILISLLEARTFALQILA